MESNDSSILVVRDSSREILRLPIGDKPIVVGRVAQSDVMLDHGSVSRRHAEIFKDADGRLHVRDLKSHNGTLVNGQPVTEHAVSSGDIIQIGPFAISILSPGGMTTRIVVGDDGGGKMSLLRDHPAPRIDLAHLTSLNDFSGALLATSADAERSRMLCRLMVGPQFRGQWAVLVRIPRGNIETPPKLLFEAFSGAAHGEPYLSRGMLRKVRETGEAVLASNSGLPDLQEGHLEISIAPSVMAMAAVACPVRLTTQTIDLLYVMLPPSLGSAEWLGLVSLAVKQHHQADSVWASRRQAEIIAAMEHELSRARQIQFDLLPKNPRFDGLDVAIGFMPCGWIGGDYADAIKMIDGRILLVIADVCGKGLPAALVASSVHTMVHSAVLSGMALADLMANLNRYLGGRLNASSFVTLIAIAIDPTTGEVEMANAGHPPMLIHSPTTGVRQVDIQGDPPLGILPEPTQVHRMKIEPDEIIVLYSDGISELGAHQSMLGIEGTSKEFCTLCTMGWTTARDASQRFSTRLDEIQNGRPSTDDRTFLLARRM